jgi:hypothetical protein
VNGTVAHIKELANLSDVYLESFEVIVILVCIKFIEFLRQKFKGFLSEAFPAFLSEAFEFATPIWINVQVFELFLFLLHLHLLPFQLLLDPSCLLLHVLPLLLIAFLVLVAYTHSTTLLVSP